MGDRGDDEHDRSKEACPICGQNRLAVLDFPEISTIGYQAYSELIGMGEAKAQDQPSIGCLACGAEWRDIAEFQRAVGRARRGERP